MLLASSSTSVGKSVDSFSVKVVRVWPVLFVSVVLFGDVCASVEENIVVE